MRASREQAPMERPMAAESRVHVGDCRVVLPTLLEDSVDALVTDPPAGPVLTSVERSGIGNYQVYAGGLTKGAPRLGAHKGNLREHRLARDRFVAFAAEAFAATCRVLKPGAFGVVWATPKTSHWTAWALDEAGLEVRDVLIQEFQGARLRATAQEDIPPEISGWNTAVRQTTDHWILVRKPPVGPLCENYRTHRTGAIDASSWASGTNLFQAPRASRSERFGHPTPKSVETMRRLVCLVSSRGALVLDPFAGCGATGEACHREGRRFVGIEVDPDFAETASERLSRLACPS